jgi:hypothetical protein
MPPEIGNLNSLERIVLNENCLFGTMPSEIGLLSYLHHIELYLNGLSGFIADDFFNLPLEYVDLSYQDRYDHANCTSSDGSVIEMDYQMGDPDNDKNVGFQGNFFEQISRLQNLRRVWLNWNSFSGSIEPDIGKLQKLGKLWFYNNMYL